MRPSSLRTALLAALLLLPAATLAQAEAATEPAPEPVAEAPHEASETDRKLEILAAEIERLRLGEVAPSATQRKFGLGPAASKVYQAERGVSLGGYGEMLYQNELDSDGTDVFDFYRNILYAGYKFDDRFVLNTEIEIEHISEVFLEFAYLDFLWRPELNVRAGLLLVPMGIINELHEPTTFLPALRPETERRIIPSTWRENGVGLFGDLGPVSYRAYLINGMDGTGFGGTGGLRGGRQKGAKALANDFGVVFRADYVGLDGLLVGGSVYYGGADQGQLDTQVTNLVYEGHVDFGWRGLKLRALYAGAQVGGALELSDLRAVDGDAPVGETMSGFYAEAGYDLLSLVEGTRLSLSPYVRYERLNTQQTMPSGYPADPASDREFLTLGLAFAPIEQVAVKAEWQRHTDAGGADDSTLNLLLGYIF
ncbi:MAG: hypothetical protein P1V51_07480 [Deltaproteobacteria bacterium]|nr:hypothetical protein [Deltaproteobacteria bacterium]